MISVPASLRRRAAEVEGWLELDCPDRALAKLGPLEAVPGALPIALYLGTRALVALERYPDALEKLQRLEAFDVDDDWFDLTEAWCLKRIGRIDQAANSMMRMVARSRNSAIGHFNLGCYLALLGDKERAIEEVTLACGLAEEFRSAAATESDLESLRGDPRFEQILP